ncbi:Beta-lactamase [Legionella pneumophila]|uniref:serine hydrolase domain-containing protein n=1 Tax=Legionella pneumophila TaxID=446 RepID=UPI0007709DB5|nr:serine hydrolase [Legionella pneumophila]CZG38485.1 Beta-lactamase [Legionella pneumophila]CZH39859.1 Beta-lactamase [Legionella pneumophila]
MPGKKKAIEELMGKTDIPGLSMATMKNGVIDYTVLGMTSCGFYKVNELPNDEQMKKIDSSRYLLTDEGLYYFNVSTNRLETVSENDLIVKNTMDKISQDPMYQKFNQIPALKADQLQHIKQETGHQFHPQKIDEGTQFGAASLSKPVFFYLILKLIEANSSQKEALGLQDFNLDTPLYKLLPGFEQGNELAKKIKVGDVLSHQTGVSNLSQGPDRPEILFEPGKEFGYAGFPLLYLQLALEQQTGKSLQELAQEFVFTPCDMKNSDYLIKGTYLSPKDLSEKSGIPKETIMAWTKEGWLKSFPIKGQDRQFYSPQMIQRAQLIDNLKEQEWTNSQIGKRLARPTPLFPIDTNELSSISANSLRTTAEDYAKFMLAWMNDEKLSKYLTTPVVKLTKDGWARAVGIEEERLNNLAWGHGIGLQLEHGEVTAVFHNGDMNQWRAVITMNPQTKTGTVFFSNSHNGDVLTQEITNGVIDARESCEYMRDKFGFAMGYEEDWEAKQMSRMKNIDLFIVGKNLEAAKLNLDIATDRLLKAQDALEKIRNPTHKPTGKNDSDWIAYEKKALELSGNVTLAEENLEKAKERYQNTQKFLDSLTTKVNEPKDSNSTIDTMIDKARKNDPKTGITGATEEEWDQEEKEYKSSYSLMSRTLTQNTPKPTPKVSPDHEKDKELSQTQRQEREQPVSSKPSEEESYKPKTPYDSMYSGPKPKGYEDT